MRHQVCRPQELGLRMDDILHLGKFGRQTNNGFNHGVLGGAQFRPSTEIGICSRFFPYSVGFEVNS